MPNRIIREGYLDSPRVAQLDAQAERFYFRMFLVVDDYGRVENRPELLKSWCFPVREDIRSADVTRWLAACEKAGLILAYEVNGRRYIQLQEFNQRTRTPSKCPNPLRLSDIREHSRAKDGLGVVVSEVDVESAVVSAVGRTADSKKPEGKQRNDGTAAWREVFEVLCDILGSQDAIQVLEYYRKQHPDCPEPIQRNVIGWAIEAKKNAKTGVLKYMLNCKQTPSDAALEETKQRLKKLRGAA